MFKLDVSTPKAKEYVSPDGSVFLPAGRVFQQGPPDSTRLALLRQSGYVRLHQRSSRRPDLRQQRIGRRTYRALVNADGTLGDLQPFAERGGESVATGPAASGNVYVANGQIFVYNPAGKQIGRIDVPERPIDIVFGGAGRRTLFILAHHALFAVKNGG